MNKPEEPLFTFLISSDSLDSIKGTDHVVRKYTKNSEDSLSEQRVRDEKSNLQVVVNVQERYQVSALIIEQIICTLDHRKSASRYSSTQSQLKTKKSVGVWKESIEKYLLWVMLFHNFAAILIKALLPYVVVVIVEISS